MEEKTRRIEVHLGASILKILDGWRRKQHDSEIATPGKGGPADLVAVGKAYLAKGVKAFKDGDMRIAYENFDMAAKHNPNDAKAFHYLALAAIRIPAYTRQAVQAIETAVQREPVNPTYLKDAGLICKHAGLNAKAERHLDEAAKWDPSNAEVQGALAELRQGRGEAKEAGKGFTLFKKG